MVAAPLLFTTVVDLDEATDVYIEEISTQLMHFITFAIQRHLAPPELYGFVHTYIHIHTYRVFLLAVNNPR